jgi:hypothetical protein
MDVTAVGLSLVCWLVFGLLALASMGVWIWMLVDCLTNEPSEGNDKVIWVLVIVLTSIVGALIYLVVRRPQRIQQFGR